MRTSPCSSPSHSESIELRSTGTHRQVDSTAPYVFGLHALMLVPLTPLQSRSDRQSSAALQIFTHVIAVPESASQTEPSGHWSVEPDVVHVAVQ